MSAHNNQDIVQIERIYEHGSTILERVERHHIDEECFFADSEIQDMLLMPLSQIGERAKRLSRQFRENHSDIPWREIAGMRDIIDHDYDNINLAVAWTTILKDIKPLVDSCESILRDASLDIN